jgi:hypothetical protein
VFREHRASLEELERSLERLVTVVDGFYKLLGPRNWIFHDSLNVSKVEAIVNHPADEAEAELIASYQDRESLRFQIGRLRRLPAIRSRLALIDLAREDYHEGRYYSATLVLIGVMDGFVNDVDPGRRRGLHAREPSELSAWDSVVGHHMGLSRAHRTFTKSFRKTADDEVFELYRNGIVHGMVTNFNNPVVATKAWNRLFAVADWAEAKEKEAEEPEPEPSWRDLISQINTNREVKESLDAWTPRKFSEEDPDLSDHAAYAQVASYLKAWQSKNYGAMATMQSALRTRGETHGKTAGRIKGEYSLVQLDDFRVVGLDWMAAAACEIDVVLTVEEAEKNGRMRWIREQANGDPAAPNQEGQWKVVSFGPFAIFEA